MANVQIRMQEIPDPRPNRKKTTKPLFTTVFLGSYSVQPMLSLILNRPSGDLPCNPDPHNDSRVAAVQNPKYLQNIRNKPTITAENPEKRRETGEMARCVCKPA
jgi:hypothetical protein